MSRFEEQFSLPLEEKLLLLNEQIAYARANSSFYSYLPSQPLQSLEEMKGIPEISCADLIAHADQMTCTPPWKVKRMVTLMTSGSTAAPKRLAFTEADIEATVDFFHHGMHCLCETGETAAIFMPGTNPDGLCDILSRGLRRFGAIPSVYGIINDFEDAKGFVLETCPAVLVGFPVQLRQLALTCPELRPGCVLLSADYCAESVIQTIEKIWHCRAFVHYGITESGLGCAVETPAEQGMIPRKDVLLEVNEKGEILLTTLKREALPLIRYNTGDLGILGEDGNLMKVLGRKQELERRVSITSLDEYLLGFDWIMDYEAYLLDDRLNIRILENNDLSVVYSGIEEKRYDVLQKKLTSILNARLEDMGQDPIKVNIEKTEVIPFTGKRLIKK